jgi:YHS domain-containing protein
MKTALTIATLALFFSCSSKRSNTEIFVVDGKAIHGYDAVAFHLDQKAVPGSNNYTYVWKDANWQFASQAHLDSFKLHPDRYAPQYGGYCAFGTAEGHKASTATETWTLKEGKLYFNYNNEVKQLWMKDQQAYINKADKLWPTVKDDEF